ncbi:MAG: sugar phosphate isomerase/epimerase [Thermogutta sp.]
MTTPLSRRGFLRGSALAAAGLAVNGLSLAEGEEAAISSYSGFWPALVCGAIGVRADQRQALDYAVKYGFRAVEPQIGFLQGLSDEELAALRKEMDENGIAWSAAGLPVDFRGDTDAFTRSLKDLPSFAAGLCRAGVDRVGTWISPTHKTRTYRANFRLHAVRLRAVADILDDHGLRLSLEYVGPKTSWSAARFPFIHTLEEMKELIAEIGHPCVGYTLDSWHWYTAGESAEDIKTIRGGDVLIVHLNDAPADVPVDRQIDSVRDLPTATGVIDLKTFLGTLADIGFQGPVYVEPFKRSLAELPPDEAVRVTAESLRRALSLVP